MKILPVTKPEYGGANAGCYLTNKRQPLPMAVGEALQPSLFGSEFEDDACESGYCVA